MEKPGRGVLNMNERKRSNEEWIAELQRPSPGCAEAITLLGATLRKGLQASFRRDQRVDSQSLEDFVQESLMKILGKLDTYRGNAAFTTWCMRIAIHHAIAELRRKRWKDISLDSLQSPDEFFSPGKFRRVFDGPEKSMMKREMVDMMNRIIQTELTDRQREVMSLVMIHGVPMETIAERLGTNRNTLYKTMHDARKRMRGVLVKKGMHIDEILEVFS